MGSHIVKFNVTFARENVRNAKMKARSTVFGHLYVWQQL